MEKYIDKGIIRYTILDFPLPMHKWAHIAAEASHCANEQGKFWEIHSLMMSKQEFLDNLPSYAIGLNLDVAKFEECLKGGKYKEQIDKTANVAQGLGISAVPAFIIASIDPSNMSEATGISFLRGAQPFDSFQKEIERVVANVSSENAASK